MGYYDIFSQWGYNSDIADLKPINKNDLTVDNIKDIVNEIIENKIVEDLSIEEKDDKLYVGGKEVMTDNYVTGGHYDDGKITLNVGEDKTTTIDNLPKEMTADEIEQIIDSE